MKNFTNRFLAILLLFAASLTATAQTEIPNPNPNTETAFLNYDFKFQSSGFQQVQGGPINVQPGVHGLLKFNLSDEYDYIFVAVSDTFTQGIAITGKPVGFDGNVVETDEDHVMTEFHSRVLVFPLPETLLGDVEIRPIILGAASPKEDSFYLLMRKRRTY